MKQNQKPRTKTKKAIDRGKRSKTLGEVKPIENISMNLQSFLETSPVQKEVLLLHKLWDYAYEYQNPFGLKEDNLSQRGVIQVYLTQSKNVRRVWFKQRFAINEIRTKASNIRKAKL